MPTFPFIGWEADYLATNPSFDIRRTPSRMGLMTELFRRMPDTVRSLHPTHPVAGWGAHAAELLATHQEGATYGEQSPFCRMREREGVVIGIGVTAERSFTIIHSAEYLHPDARAYAFSEDPHTVALTDGAKRLDYSFRPLRPRLDRRIDESKLSAAGALSNRRRRGLLIASANTSAFIEQTCRMISDGTFYRSGPLAARS